MLERKGVNTLNVIDQVDLGFLGFGILIRGRTTARCTSPLITSHIRKRASAFDFRKLIISWSCQANAKLSPVLEATSGSKLEKPMQAVSFKRHRFPPDIIRHAVWLYFRFTLSFRDVEEMLAERGIDASYEAIRCWSVKFGRLFAQNLRRSRPRPTGRWHLDEMVVKINGKRMWSRVQEARLWRSSPAREHAEKQPSRELASGHSTTGEKAAEV
jgi:hypothetical protein